jgi:hypothetical protein
MNRNNYLSIIIIFTLTILNLIGIFIAYARVIALNPVTCYSQSDPYLFDFIFRLSIGFIYLSGAIMFFSYLIYKKKKDKRILLSIKIAFISLIISFSLLGYTFFKGMAF